MTHKKELNIWILVDNLPGDHTESEHGLSYLIEYDGHKILFDTGQTDLFLKNAEIIGVNTGDVHYIVLSHGHYDHGNGLNYINGGNLICHPGSFVKRYRKEGGAYIGLKNDAQTLAQRFNLTTTTQPHTLSPNVVFLGEIPRVTQFESQTTSFVFDNGTPDFVMDDSALAIKMPNGLFVITGCGHAGIANTLEHAKGVTGEKRILGILGGFHLKQNDRQTQKTIEYLKTNNVRWVYPSHCTAEPALNEFHKHFKAPRIRTGDILSFTD